MPTSETDPRDAAGTRYTLVFSIILIVGYVVKVSFGCPTPACPAHQPHCMLPTHRGLKDVMLYLASGNGRRIA